jgi:hypothetical protein
MSVEEVIASLDSQTEPKKWFRLGRAHTMLQGTFSSDGFKITRIIHYRNSFLPIIRGTFGSGPSGTTIAIKMGLHPLVAAFMCFWFGGVGVGILAVLAALSRGQTEWNPMLLIPFGILLFGWALVSGGFWFEANKTKPVLLEMFSGRERHHQGTQGDEENPA